MEIKKAKVGTLMEGKKEGRGGRSKAVQWSLRVGKEDCVLKKGKKK